jgi:hypothetical protein
MEYSCFVGIDVSKAHLDIHIRPTGDAFRVSHDEAGLASLLGRVCPLEPTDPAVWGPISPRRGSAARIAIGPVKIAGLRAYKRYGRSARGATSGGRPPFDMS